MVSRKGQQSGCLLPHDYRIEHRRQDAHTENGDNAGTHKDARTEERQTSAESTVLGLPGPPEPSYPLGYLSEGRPLPTRFGIEREVLFPAEPAAFQRVCWASALCWLERLGRPGPDLTPVSRYLSSK